MRKIVRPPKAGAGVCPRPSLLTSNPGFVSAQSSRFGEVFVASVLNSTESSLHQGF